MSISNVQIANMALSHIGARSAIQSFTESSTEAAQAQLWFEYCLKQVLESYDWAFARKRVALALLETVSDDTTDNAYYEWVYRYQYPSDCLVMRKISNPAGPQEDAVPYEVEASEDNETRTIFTNMEDAIGVYTFYNDEPSMFSSHFVDTVAALLAHRMAYAITGKRTIANDMLQLYQAMIRAAPAVDANERMDPPPRDADWIRERGTIETPPARILR
jgi:hypothetical protein